MIIENENTLLRHLESGINFFVGAGFSVEAKNNDKSNLPAGGTLAEEIIEHFDIKELRSLELPQIATVLESNNKENFFKFLKQRFKVSEYDSLYDSLLSINIKSIITTNIDDLWSKIISKSNKFYINDITISGPAYQDRSAIDYIPLHGCVNHKPVNLLPHSGRPQVAPPRGALS